MNSKRFLALGIAVTGLAGVALAQGQQWKIVHLERGDSTVVTNRGGATFKLDESVARGSGRLVTEARSVGPFRRILADDGANVEVVVGGRTSVQVEADDNLTRNIRTIVENGTLKVDYDGSYATNLVPRVRVTVPALDAIDLRASSDANVRGLEGGRLVVSTVGSGDLNASGRLDEIRVSISGSGDVDLAALRTGRVDIVVNGSGDADVGSPRALSAVVNGSGDIRYSGSPAPIHRAVHGSGSVRQKSR